MSGSLRRAVQGFPEGGKRIRLGQGGKMGWGGGGVSRKSLALNSPTLCMYALWQRSVFARIRTAIIQF